MEAEELQRARQLLMSRLVARDRVEYAPFVFLVAESKPANKPPQTHRCAALSVSVFMTENT